MKMKNVTLSIVGGADPFLFLVQKLLGFTRESVVSSLLPEFFYLGVMYVLRGANIYRIRQMWVKVPTMTTLTETNARRQNYYNLIVLLYIYFSV